MIKEELSREKEHWAADNLERAKALIDGAFDREREETGWGLRAQQHAWMILSAVPPWRDPRELDTLEIGCGVGRLVKILAGYFKSITGQDISPEMLKLAEEYLKGTDATLLRGDGWTLKEIGPGMVDFVYAVTVFQHIPDNVLGSYMREIARVLRKGGVFRFQIKAGDKSDAQPERFSYPRHTEDFLVYDHFKLASKTVGGKWEWVTMVKRG